MPKEEFDYTIDNGLIIDGSGNPWFKANIGIKDGKISKISRLPLKGDAKRNVNAKKQIVCPGFINIHSHSDGSILNYNNAENCIAMGVTTEIVGNCGTSAAPITVDYRDRMNEASLRVSWGFPTYVDWISLDDWFKKVETNQVGINVGSLIGHTTVRRCIMGEEGKGGERIVPTQSEMNEMKTLVESGMKDGALGVSTGLSYPVGRNALTEELIEFVEVAAKYGGVYFSHMRNEGNMLIEATNEFIKICEKTGARGSISHHKAAGPANFGKIHETLRLVDSARKRDVDIIVDLYPWRIGGMTKSLGSRFMKSLDGEKNLSRLELVEHLKDQATWIKIKERYIKEREATREAEEERKHLFEKEGGWSPTPSARKTEEYILYSKSHPELNWKTHSKVDQTLGKGEYLEGIRILLIADMGYTVTGNYPFNEEDIHKIASYPWSTFITDQHAIDNSKYSLQNAADRLSMEHPRGWGTYAKILGEYVREKKILRIEEAIRKITSLPANLLGIPDRGLIKENFWADIVVFDPETVKSNATYENPFLFPSGIPYVFVNGVLTKDGDVKGELAGKILRRQ